MIFKKGVLQVIKRRIGIEQKQQILDNILTLFLFVVILSHLIF